MRAGGGECLLYAVVLRGWGENPRRWGVGEPGWERPLRLGGGEYSSLGGERPRADAGGGGGGE